jgi:hypothetical protein
MGTNMTEDTEKLISILKWRESIETLDGDFIIKTAIPTDLTHFDETHYAFGDITSQDLLDQICYAANFWWAVNNKNIGITNHMGEIIPTGEKHGHR